MELRGLFAPLSEDELLNIMDGNDSPFSKSSNSNSDQAFMRGQSEQGRASNLSGLMMMNNNMMADPQEPQPLSSAPNTMMQQPNESIRQHLLMTMSPSRKDAAGKAKQVDPLLGDNNSAAANQMASSSLKQDAKRRLSSSSRRTGAVGASSFGAVDLSSSYMNASLQHQQQQQMMTMMNNQPNSMLRHTMAAGWPQSNVSNTNMLSMNNNNNLMDSSMMQPSQFRQQEQGNFGAAAPMEQAMIQQLQQMQQQQQQQTLSNNAGPQGSMGFNSNSNINHNDQIQQQNELETLRLQQRILLNSAAQADNSLLSGSTKSVFPMDTNALPSAKKPTKKRQPRKKRSQTFPQKLHQVLSEHASDDVFAWLPDGKSFMIVNDELFCQRVLSQAFKACKYSSFVRKLHRWGFIRLSSGQGTDSFQHPLFQKDKPELAGEIDSSPREPQARKAIVDSKNNNSTDASQEQQQVSNTDFASFAQPPPQQQPFGGVPLHPPTSQQMHSMMSAGTGGNNTNMMMRMGMPNHSVFLNQQQSLLQQHQGNNSINNPFGTANAGSSQQQNVNQNAFSLSMLEPKPFLEESHTAGDGGADMNDPGDLPVTDDVWDDSDDEE